MLTHRNETLCSLLLANYNHVRNTLELVVANLAADFLVAVVDECAYASLVEECLHLASVVVILLRDRKDSHLIRDEPQWEVTCCMLDEYGCEAFERTERSAVNHNRCLL